MIRRPITLIKSSQYYYSIYKEFIKTNITEASSFRISFILFIILDLVFYFSTLATVEIIYQHIEFIGPWNKHQLMFFAAFMISIDHLHMCLISEGFWSFSSDLKTGQLDFILLRPAHSLFSIFFRYIRPSGIVNSISVLFILIYYGLKVQLTLLAWTLLPFMIILAFTLLAILEIMISTLMFWVIEGHGVNFFRMQFQQVSRWPDFIYQYSTRKFFTFFLPFLLVGNAPVYFLFDPSNFYYLLIMLIAIIVSFSVLLKIWSYALSRYESASS